MRLLECNKRFVRQCAKVGGLLSQGARTGWCYGVAMGVKELLQARDVRTAVIELVVGSESLSGQGGGRCGLSWFCGGLCGGLGSWSIKIHNASIGVDNLGARGRTPGSLERTYGTYEAYHTSSSR